MIHIYYGDGKGKTSAAIGLGIRACGQNLKVIMAQFLKSDKSGEINTLKCVPNFKVLDSPENLPFFYKMSDVQKDKYIDFCLSLFNDAINFDSDVIIFDELLDAAKLDIIPLEFIVTFLKEKSLEKEIVITGHYVIDEIFSFADYITEVRKIKHPYDKGCAARRGIEF
ncbi:MAG: cob(I)yrinic acid a,c-diamide adenosyltransferase [Oscillospiraceae bacterium]|nr:cob(I)yrinic acid a,c-diamide adenosyltransferase [Oscillospiraceae bacterium]